MIEATWGLIIFIIGVALVFDFTNGFHDSANSISTVVSTKVLSPRNAVIFAAFFNFIAAFGFGVAGASTISKIIKLDFVQTGVIPYIILSALIGAIAWNLITWFSGSHILIARAYWRACRCGYIRCRVCCHQVVHGRAGCNVHGHLPYHRAGYRFFIHGDRALDYKKIE